MTDTQHDWHEGRIDWDHFGRAAERFARRLARDAGRFAERISEHAGEFADEVSREWRHGRRRESACGDRHHTGPEVRHIFEDIRGVLSDIIDGVDELIERVFQGPTGSAEGDWERMVINRDAVCAGCDRPLQAGEDAHVRRTAEGLEVRCVACGEPATEST